MFKTLVGYPHGLNRHHEVTVSQQDVVVFGAVYKGWVNNMSVDGVVILYLVINVWSQKLFVLSNTETLDQIRCYSSINMKRKNMPFK